MPKDRDLPSQILAGRERPEAARMLAQLLRFIVALCLAGLLTVPLFVGRRLEATLIYAVLGLGAAAGFWAIRLGHVRQVAVGVSALTWLLIWAAVLTSGGMASPALFAFPAVLLLAGLFWSGRAALWLSAVTVAGTAGVVWAELSLGWFAQPRSPLDQWISFVLAVLGTALLVNAALGTMARWLGEAERNQQLVLDILEQSPDAVLLLDAGGRVERVNIAAEKLLARSRESLLGLAAEDVGIKAPEPGEALYELFARAAHGEPMAPLEVELTRPDGSTVIAEAALSPMVQDGSRARVQVTVREITERLRQEGERDRVERELLHAQKLDVIGQLAGGVAHDFNNYLAVILGATDLANGQLASGASPAEALREIRAAAERSASLTRQLLAFSRKQASHEELLDPNAVVTNITKLMRRVLGERIQLERQLSADAGWVRVDPTQLDVALVNLCVNARDAMPAGGRLVLATECAEVSTPETRGGLPLEPGRYVVISVTDDGVGMSEEVRRRIFEPFFTTKADGQGTGLGLSTVHEFARHSRGAIDVTSEPGRGASFRVLLPVAQREESSRAASNSERVQTGGAGTVLLVEDDEMVRGVERTILSRGGYTVLEAGNAEQAIELARLQPRPVDLLVSDVILPTLKGPELAAELRTFWPGLRVLYVSGYLGENAETIPASSADALLPKPFGAVALLDAVRAAIARQAG